jgi:hypothetical protein
MGAEWWKSERGLKCRAEQEQNKDLFVLYIYHTSFILSEGHVSINIRQQDHLGKGSMYCVIKCIMCGHQAHVKNADLRHLSCTVVMYKHICVTHPQCVKFVWEYYSIV